MFEQTLRYTEVTEDGAAALLLKEGLVDLILVRRGSTMFFACKDPKVFTDIIIKVTVVSAVYLDKKYPCFLVEEDRLNSLIQQLGLKKIDL